MAAHRVTVVVHREGDQYVAQCLEVEVSSFGDTREEAEAMITEALELYLEGEPAPKPLEDPALTVIEVSTDG
ncbi:type II toxin-antitoxin system HicB family antitoxin [Nocardiopsis trehalosi]|jgi:predicted RNase H-like HicB family nuclease|uniref:type II toxin-antitoxin system HicB family antitoxin n=1 Tax=Nocardiopsis trehalosi TaxID=109329 RepID=UPI0008357375|nr:type II toxin-antitoxin system HicB family antitoxin [Nocardiopsis trehalosi]